MPQSQNRELISISTQAHQHLKTVVAAKKKSGIPTSGTMLVSELILSLPIPQPAGKKPRRVRKVESMSTAAAV